MVSGATGASGANSGTDMLFMQDGNNTSAAQPNYSVAAKAPVYARFDVDSAIVGHLQRGQVIAPLAQRTNNSGTIRVRFTGGWVSKEALDGDMFQVRSNNPRVLELGLLTTRYLPSCGFGTADATCPHRGPSAGGGNSHASVVDFICVERRRQESAPVPDPCRRAGAVDHGQQQERSCCG